MTARFRKPFRAMPIKEGKVYRRKRRYARAERIGVSVVVLAAAAAIGTGIGLTPSLGFPSLGPGYSNTVSGCAVTDGDTIRCNGERIRLLGIDAPELPGHCRTGRNCAPGDGYASKRSLDDAMIGTIHISRVGEDHYGRTLAILSSERGDLSCWQLQHGEAVYKPQWDDGRRLAGICSKAALLSY